MTSYAIRLRLPQRRRGIDDDGAVQAVRISDRGVAKGVDDGVVEFAACGHVVGHLDPGFDGDGDRHIAQRTHPDHPG